jgi:hypothetical protein
MPDTSIRRIRAAASGIRAGAPPSRPRSPPAAAPSAAPSPRPAPRPAAARRSTSATAAAAFGGLDVRPRSRRERAEIAPALPARRRRPGRRSTPPDRARRHANKSRLGGNATSPSRWRPRTRPPPPGRHAAVAPSRRRRGRPVMPLPEIQIFGGGAHAGRPRRHPGLPGGLPRRHRTSPRRWTGPPRSIAPPALMMAAGGKRQGVADEGGWWPAFAANEEALRPWCARSSAPASSRARRWRSRSTSPPPSSAATGATASRLESASYGRDGMGRAARRAGSAAIPSCRSRTRWPRTTPTAWPPSPPPSGAENPGGRRRLPGHQRRPHRGRGARAPATAALIKPNQAAP